MKIVKPLRQGLLFKPYEYRHQAYLAVTVFSFFGFDQPRALIQESQMWPFVTGQLGKETPLDMGMPKARGEVLVIGDCFPPGGEPGPGAEVTLEMGSLAKSLVVSGQRVWLRKNDMMERMLNGSWEPSQPEPFERMAMDWAHAFGGEQFAQNPLGKGHTPEGEEPEDGRSPLPNVEYPDQMVAGPWSLPVPAGLGPMDLMWPQRQVKAGTYDQEWAKHHFPGLAPDIDWSFYNTAAEDQQIKGYWQGDEDFVIHGMHPEDASVSGVLPNLRSRCFINQKIASGESFQEIPLKMDTVWLFPADQKGITVHRGFAPVSADDASDVSHLLLAYEYRNGEQRDQSHYRQALLKRLDKEQRLFWMGREDDLCPPEEADSEDYQPPDPAQDPRVQKIVAPIREQAAVHIEKMRAQMVKLGLKPEDYLPKAKVDSQIDQALKETPPLPPAYRGPQDMPRMMKYLQGQWGEFKAQSRTPAELTKDITSKLEANESKFQDRFHAILAKEGYSREQGEEFLAKARQQGASQSAAMEGMNFSQALDHLSGRFMNQPELKGNKVLEEKIAQFKAKAKDLDAQMAKLGLPEQAKKMKIKAASMGPPPPLPSPQEQKDLRAKVEAALAKGESLAGWDLTGAGLAGLAFKGADLKGAILDSADLSGCDFSQADLSQACLARAQLKGAVFIGAVLQEASLGKAKAAGADFSQTKLGKAFLAEAELEGAKFSQAKAGEANFMKAKLSQAQFDGVQAEKAFFLQADLSGSSWQGAGLGGVRFLQANLNGADFSQAKLAKAVFVKAQAVKASFCGAEMFKVCLAQDCDFSRADCSGCVSKSANWRSSLLAGAKFDQAMLDGSDFSESDLSGASFKEASCRKSSFMKSILNKAELNGANLFQASLMKAKLDEADLSGANLYSAETMRASVKDIKTQGANLTMCKLGEQDDDS